MKTAYLLPCPCGLKSEVDAGQAGSQITCACGKMLMVPSVRGLRQLEPAGAPPAPPKPRAWNPARGAIFSLGLFVAVAALLYAGVQGYFFRISQRTQDPAAVQLSIEYEHIDHLSHVDSMAVFRQEEKDGLGTPTPPHWTEIDKLHVASGRKAIIGLIVAGVGLLATAGSMVGRPKQSA